MPSKNKDMKNKITKACRFKEFQKLSAFQQIVLILKNHLFCHFFRNRFGSLLQIGDIVEMQPVSPYNPEQNLGEPKIYTVEKLFIAPNAYSDRPTEVVIVINLSYNEGKSSVECTIDRFKYIKHLYPNEKQIQKRLR